ncbi:MAG: acetyl-CoA carboxylase biotin carboxyl carrier protein [Micromonosporaceae bacterium]
MSLSNDDVQEIVRLLDDLNATELHLRTRHFTLWLRRDGPDGGWSQATSVTSDPRQVAGEAAVEAVAPPAATAAPAPPVGGDRALVAVRAPLMGTFYRAPKPGAAPFVEVGTAVEEETVVGILETMKLMSSVYAGARGRVAEICVANAGYAEQGAVLMRVGPERVE